MDSNHTVYKDEVISLSLTVELLKNTHRVQTVSIAFNNQAMIKALATNHVKIYWIPGYTELPGNNKLGDKEVKKSVVGDLFQPSQLSKQFR